MRIDLADLDDLLDLGDGHPPRLGAGDIEVVGGLAQDQVAGLVGLPGLDDRQVGGDALLEDVRVTVVLPDILPLGQPGAVAGAGVEGRDAGAAGPQLLGQRPLRRQLDLELAGQELLLEGGVLADVGGDHLFDLPGLQQQPEAELVDPGVVADHGQPVRRRVAQGDDQFFRDAAEAEAAGGDGHIILQQAFKRPARIFVYRFHRLSFFTQTRSNRAATASPPPMQSAATP